MRLRSLTILPRTEDGCVILRGRSVPLDSEIGLAFTQDCARYVDGLIAESDIKKKWGLSDDAWQALAQNETALQAVQRERERRLVNGVGTTEAARYQFTKAPSVLGDILTNDGVSPRHRIEAARELRAIVGTNASGEKHIGEQFTITINLGADDKRVYHVRQPIIDNGEADK